MTFPRYPGQPLTAEDKVERKDFLAITDREIIELQRVRGWRFANSVAEARARARTVEQIRDADRRQARLDDLRRRDVLDAFPAIVKRKNAALLSRQKRGCTIVRLDPKFFR